MPKGQKTDAPEQIAKLVHLYDTYHELPLASTGCDSYPSWHPAFKKFSPMMTTDELFEAVRASVPETTPFENVHIVITGGEPLLGWQRAWPELMDRCIQEGVTYFTFETNGTQRLSDDFAAWLRNTTADVLFSFSPKLSCSGEEHQDAIKPDIVAQIHDISVGNSYLKFVVAEADDEQEILDVISEYRATGYDGDVYLMPVGGTEDLYSLTSPEVAKMAMRLGLKFSPRLQVDLWRNAHGT